MKSFTSLDLQQRSGEIHRDAIIEPVIVTNHGRPRLVVSSVEEFSRLKRASGEPVPEELQARQRPKARKGIPDDPLGYDTSDFLACARAMAKAALSGKNRARVDAEIAAFERRLTGDK